MRLRIRYQTPTPTAAALQAISQNKLRVRTRPMRVLDFDTESRPLSWINSEYVSQEITAMAWAWCDKPEDVTCLLLGEVDQSYMLTRFVEAYNQADMVSGHFLFGHDLPLINAMLMENQLPTLGDKLAQDTKTQLVKRRGISSSQENLAAMLLLEHDKVKMNQDKWRRANRLTPEGREESRIRCVGDVQQHMELRRKLFELGYLAPAKWWRGGTAMVAEYTP